MNIHAQALGRLGGLGNKGKKKSESHKAALRKVLSSVRRSNTQKPETPSIIKRRCQSPYCTNEGKAVLVQGMKAWLCEEHFK